MDHQSGGFRLSVYMALHNLSVLSKAWWTTRPFCWAPVGCQQPLLGAEAKRCQESQKELATRQV